MSLALVTGGAGFIGSHIVRRLLGMGRRVRVLDNLSTGHKSNLADVQADVEFIEGSICDADAARGAAKDVEWVFHLAARPSVPWSVEHPLEANAANVTGTLNMLLAARDGGAQSFVYSASSAAYGDTPTLPKVETMTPAPLSPYGVSKLTGEYYCSCCAQVYGMNTLSLRYFNVFGPRQDPKSAYAAAIPAFVSQMVRGERPTIFGDGEQTRDFCYIDNVVNANLLAAQSTALGGQVVNIACGERTSLNRIITLINEQLGTSIEPIYGEPRAGDVRDSLASIDAAKRVIGYEPGVMFAEGLTRSIEWYRAAAG